MTTQPPSVPWGEFYDKWRWKQDEHVSLIGPTGGGKTTLAFEILGKRTHAVALAVKPQDSTVQRFAKRDGYRRIKRWSEVRAQDKKVLLWPPFRAPEDTKRQQEIIDEALRKIFAERNRTILADELAYLCDTLKLKEHFKMFWRMGRSVKTPVVAIGQRPAWLPREIYSQPDHLFFWRTQDEQDLRSIGGCGGTSAKLIRQIVGELPKHNVLYVNTRNGEMVVTNTQVGSPKGENA